eukprot:jgi/Botrbrau1/17003/Bobra.49_2s0062.1
MFCVCKVLDPSPEVGTTHNTSARTTRENNFDVSMTKTPVAAADGCLTEVRKCMQEAAQEVKASLTVRAAEVRVCFGDDSVSAHEGRF